MIKTGKTYEVNIWIGLREGYHGKEFPINDLDDICQDYVKCGLCVTVSPTKFIYTDGSENGVKIGLINYPRFPSTNRAVLNHAIQLAKLLMKTLKQYRCTVMDSTNTYLLDSEE